MQSGSELQRRRRISQYSGRYQSLRLPGQAGRPHHHSDGSTPERGKPVSLPDRRKAGGRQVDRDRQGAGVGQRPVVANFLDDNGVSRWHDIGAFSSDDDAPWYWVHWVKNC